MKKAEYEGSNREEKEEQKITDNSIENNLPTPNSCEVVSDDNNISLQQSSNNIRCEKQIEKH